MCWCIHHLFFKRVSPRDNFPWKHTTSNRTHEQPKQPRTWGAHIHAVDGYPQEIDLIEACFGEPIGLTEREAFHSYNLTPLRARG